MIKKISAIIVIIALVGSLGYSIYESQIGIYSYDGKKSMLQDLHYEVTILKDGNAMVDEYRTYKFLKGFFSRGYLEVEGEVDNVTVFENEKAYQKMDAFDTGRPEGYFAVEPSGRKTRIEWYYRSGENETKIFKIQYRVHGAATLYNDCVDYFQKYVSSDNVYKIKNLSVLVHLPQGATQDNTKIWAHGPVGGNVDFQGETDVMLTMKGVPPGNYIEARFLMPAEVIKSGGDKVSMDRYNELYEMENQAAEESDEKATFNGFISVITMMISVLIMLLPMISIIRYRRKLKRLKPEVEPKYYRDLPSNIYPAELDYLMNHYTGKINSSQQISATVLDMINKGLIQGEVKEDRSVFGKKKDTIFITSTKKWDGVAPHEKLLLQFLFNTVGKGSDRVSLKEIKKFCSNNSSAKEAYKFYTDFESKVKSIVKGRGFFETKRNALPKSMTRYIIIYIILLILPIILMNMIEALSSTPIFYISIASFVGFMMVAFFGGKEKPLLTQKGEDQSALWKAFKTFLGDFTTFDKKELPELFMWEKYLVYATVLGVAQKLLKQLYAKYPELADIQENSRLFYLINDGSYHNSYQSFNEIGSTFNDAMRQSINIMSKSSKGSGGGFSSGGSDSGSGAGGSSGGVD
ncbi:MAG: DUF2207 family protein [Eubacteriales bacterium]